MADTVMENDDVSIILRYKASAYLKMADHAVKQDETEPAIEYLQQAADNVLKSIRSPQKSTPSSLLANTIEANSTAMSDFRMLQMHHLSSEHKYDFLRSDDRFKRICSMLEAIS